MASKRKIYTGWKIVGAGVVIQALHSALMLQAFGNYAVILRESFGWSKSFFSAVYSLNRVESGLLGPLQGWALERLGTRLVMRVGLVVMAGGFLGLSQINSRTTFLLAFLVTAVGMSLSGFLTVTTVLVGWFEKRRALALSMAGTGFAIGGLATPLVVYVLQEAGWRATAAGSGVLILVIGFPMTKRFGTRPEDYGEHLDGLDPERSAELAKAEGISDVHFTARQALRTRAFWMISLGHGSALLSVGAVVAHLSLYLTSERGFTLQEASFMGGALPLIQFVGLLAGGYLGDRFNKRLLASLAMMGHMLGVLVLTYAPDGWMLWMFVPLHGFAWGVRGPLMQALRADYFGPSSFGQIMGLSSLVIMIGTMAGPLIAGISADTTGSYQTGFTIIALLVGAGMIFFILATPPKPQPAAVSATP